MQTEKEGQLIIIGRSRYEAADWFADCETRESKTQRRETERERER
eukprot:COSAG03_NODE_9163_length_741_cov_1.817757_2_plen_44_part_01